MGGIDEKYVRRCGKREEILCWYITHDQLNICSICCSKEALDLWLKREKHSDEADQIMCAV